MDDLKPCPFCGDAKDEDYAPSLRETRCLLHNDQIGCSVYCPNCGIEFNEEYADDLIEKWNTRPASPSPASKSVTMDREHMLDELEAVILDTHDLDVTDRCYAKAVLRWIERNAPAVKPLVWRVSFGVFRAETPFGDYMVMGKRLQFPAPLRTEQVRESEEAAKAAAQADYEARIRSALTTEGEG